MPAMSVRLEPSTNPLARATRAAAASAAVDPRVAALVSGFDAPFFQAGLAGYSDGAMRLMARRHGCPYCVTEALLDRTLINGGKGRTREDPDLLAEECGSGDPQENRAAGLDDHPIAGQIIGTNPDEMAAGAAILVQMGHDVIDVNLACPVKKVKRRNRGGHFLGAPDEAIALLRAVRRAVPPAIPTTVKLRRGWDEGREWADRFQRIFDAAYELGYAWATVHCRTVQQRYEGPGRWEFLADLVRRRGDRVIFGSGDIWSAADIFAMMSTTGVQGVSVARGCIGNPWIFRQARQLMAGLPAPPPTVQEQRRVLLEHFDLAVALHGEQLASRLMRKFGIKFAAHHPRAAAVKADFVGCASAEAWRAVIERHYGEAEDQMQRAAAV
jgi:nifR3 family TIM-barrel protein